MFLNLTIENSYEANTFNCTIKDVDPFGSTVCGFWNVWVLSSLNAGRFGQPLFHMNSPTTDFVFQSGTRNIQHSIPINSSGSLLVIGSQFELAKDNTAEPVMVSSSHAFALINSKLWRHHDTTEIVGSGDASNILETNGNSGIGVSAEAEVTIINSIIGGSAATGIWRWGFVADGHTSVNVRVLYTSFVSGGDAFGFLMQDADTYRKTFFMRASLIDKISTNIFGSNNDYDHMNWNIVDTIYDDSESGTNDWDMDTNNIDTRALARDDMVNGTDILCGGQVAVSGVGNNCDNFFFGGTCGSSCDLAGTDAHGPADNDLVQLGGCHKDVANCYQASRFSSLEVLNERLKLPTWALPSGEQVFKWKVNPNGELRDIGGGGW